MAKRRITKSEKRKLIIFALMGLGGAMINTSVQDIMRSYIDASPGIILVVAILIIIAVFYWFEVEL